MLPGIRQARLLASRAGMFLRSLTIRGFKSFAEKTTLEFTPGIGAVVGPNGAGKSNLVDAIAWVLGEQGPAALRGGQMADVIFAGSPGRPSLGMAEVSLVIDNSQGLIPVELSEIEIARVVYRSGESQYLIGGQPVRLTDVQEILSDTGIGRAMHTVVGQGHLEDVLSARPEERRQLIEEAAGIAKHRRRKERAQRKLISLEQDLLRLHDVMAELRRQLKPLKQQAQHATRYQALTDEAETLAWRLAAARLRELYRGRERRRSAWEEGRARRQEAEERLASLDSEIVVTKTRRAEAEEGLLRAEAEEGKALRARSEREAALREAVRAEGDARARVAAESGRSGRLFTLEEEVAHTEEALLTTLRSLEEKEAALAEAERIHARAVRVRREAEEEQRKAHEIAAARRAELEHLRRSLESLETERDRLVSEIGELDRRAANAAEERQRVQAEVERLDAEETPLARRQTDGRHVRERLGSEIDALEARERRLDARMQGLDARRKALAATPGRRFLKRRPGRAIGLLADLIRVQQGAEAAVAAALGPWGDAVVYLDHGHALAEARHAGGVLFGVAGRSARAAPSFAGEAGLISKVEADPRVRGLIEEILRDVYLASDEQEALEKHRRSSGAAYVTPGGILVGPDVVRIAPRVSEEEEAIRAEEVVVERELDLARRELAGRRADMNRLNAELAAVGDQLDRTDDEITSAAERLTRIDAEVGALDREREVLVQRRSRVEEGLLSLQDAIGRLPPGDPQPSPLPPLPEPPFELQVEVEGIRRERGRLESGLRKARAEVARLKAEGPAQVHSRATAATTARTAAERLLGEAEVRAKKATSTREKAATTAAQLRAAEARANEAWRDAIAQLQRLRDEYEEEDQARRDVERRIDDAERILTEGHRRDSAAAVASLSDAETVESLEREAEVIARRLALIGRVNLVAAEEYQALQERHDFLQREIDDVKSARADLMHVVREVDRKIVDIFDGAFQEVAAEFSQLFTTLFPGGEGRLVLTDTGDLLGSGVAIEARPGRKRVNRLSLLSGGERALTALGFLFAIFRARPSPFYLLDEVEAALDDVNLHRFLDLIRGFSQTSQVLLVTHQKRTMETADVLYGVSMGSDGASAVICQRISEGLAAGVAGSGR